ncbi:MAG: T9SS type A sorting domain-containing protein [Bacteroidota bacterium]
MNRLSFLFTLLVATIASFGSTHFDLYFFEDALRNTASLSKINVEIDLVSATDPLCFDEFSGGIEVEAEGGMEPYQYSLNGGAFVDSPIFSGLDAGDYTIMVQDNDGATDQLMISLENPTELTGQLVEKIDNVCSDGATGSILVSASGGTSADGTYRYAINGGMVQDTGLFEGLLNGFYVISIFDDNQCETQVTATIFSPPKLELVLLEKIDVSCFGAGDGSCSVGGFGGTPAYLYSFDDGPFEEESDYSGLGGGTHVIRVMDSEGCVEELIVFIDEPENVTFDLTASELICYGDDNGIVEVNNVMGTAPFKYQLNGGIPDTLAEFIGLTGGEYEVTVIDSLGCVFMQEINVNEPDSLILEIEIIEALVCEGDSSAVVQLEEQNGVGQITYSIDQMFNFSGMFENLGEGEYLASVTDSLGCTTEIGFELQEISLFEVILDSIFHVTCHDGSNGSISINVSNGIEPMSFSIDGINFQDTSYFEGLSAGDYEVQVMDSLGCMKPLSLSISEPVPLEFDFLSVINIFCNDGEGGVQFSVVGGTPPYLYSASNGEEVELTPNEWYTDLGIGVGEYLVSVSDFNQCIFTDTVTIMLENDSLILNVDSLVGDDCSPIRTGYLELSATGGLGGYRYTLNNGPAIFDGVFDSLAFGTYIATVFDSAGCSFDLEITIPQLEGLVLDSLFISDVSCAGASDGFVEVFIGNAEGEVFLLLDEIVYTDNSIEDLEGGNFIALAEDEIGCTLDFEFEIFEPDSLVLEFVEADLAQGILEVVATGGTEPFLFSIDDKATTQDSSRFIGLESGTYTIIIIDANGCESEFTYSLTSSEEEVFGNLAIYPNPVHNRLYLKMAPESTDFKIDILNSIGQIVLRYDSKEDGIGEEEIVFECSDWATGSYWLRLQTNEGSKVFAFYKN